MNTIKPGAFTIDQILSAKERDTMIARAEKMGFGTRAHPSPLDANTFFAPTFYTQRIKFMPILFYGTKDVPYGCFSNFSAHPFDLDNRRWRTSEHYFQAMKFYPHWEHINAIGNMPSPMQAAKAGRSRARPLRIDWEEVKNDIMRQALHAKFTQHAEIQKILLETGDEDIIENTTKDHYWGCGSTGTGKNMLGKLLMELRDNLRTLEVKT